jgi:hypothetical protein
MSRPPSDDSLATEVEYYRPEEDGEQARLSRLHIIAATTSTSTTNSIEYKQKAVSRSSSCRLDSEQQSLLVLLQLLALSLSSRPSVPLPTAVFSTS